MYTGCLMRDSQERPANQTTAKLFTEIRTLCEVGRRQLVEIKIWKIRLRHQKFSHRLRPSRCVSGGSSPVFQTFHRGFEVIFSHPYASWYVYLKKKGWRKTLQQVYMRLLRHLPFSHRVINVENKQYEYSTALSTIITIFETSLQNVCTIPKRVIKFNGLTRCKPWSATGELHKKCI